MYNLSKILSESRKKMNSNQLLKMISLQYLLSNKAVEASSSLQLATDAI
jgi:hypothetical protein